jgi:hypothetical protein
LREQGEQLAFRSFGEIANRAAHHDVGSVNDELPRRADTLLDRLRRRRAQGANPDHEKTVSGGTHRCEPPKTGGDEASEKPVKEFFSYRVSKSELFRLSGV